jgi:hypothetical protein
LNWHQPFFLKKKIMDQTDKPSLYVLGKPTFVALQEFIEIGKPVKNKNNIGTCQGYYTLSGPNSREQYGQGEQWVEPGVPYIFRVWPKVPVEINCHLCKKDGLTYFTWNRNKQWLFGSLFC